MLNLTQQELKKLDFNKSEYEYFIENCNFTDNKEIKIIKHKILKII